MLRILIEPSTYTIDHSQDKQNPFINIHHPLNMKKAKKTHEQLSNSFTQTPVYYKQLHQPKTPLPDIVFCASAGLSLPRLSKPLVLLPNMKYDQRKNELAVLKDMFRELKIRTIDYPGNEPFEGQAELKWFDGGRKAVFGYGYRSTKKTLETLNSVFEKVYGDNAPQILALPLQSADFYHLDLALLAYSDTKCIVHEKAFSKTSLDKLKKFLGNENVTVTNTNDKFGLNSIIDGDTLITHRLTDAKLKPLYEELTGLHVKEIDTTEFEKSGGSVRCMVLDVYTGTKK